MIDISENVDGNPKERDMLGLMKKELSKMKVAENSAESFRKKEGTTTDYQEDTNYYVWTTDDNRSKRDKRNI